MAGPNRKILVVLHQKNSTPGRVGAMLQQRGFRLDIRRPRFGDQLPRSLQAYSGAVIFGGPMSANDKDAFVKREIDWIETPLKEGVPFLGICLGAQMFAKQLGGRVYRRSDGKVEVGYYPICPTDKSEMEFVWPQRVYQWHQEGFTLPDEAELLATGDLFSNQAFRFGPSAYGIQFHPEVTLHMMHRWTVSGSARLELPGAKKRQDHFRGRYLFDPAVERWLSDFLDHWLAGGRDKTSY